MYGIHRDGAWHNPSLSNPDGELDGSPLKRTSESPNWYESGRSYQSDNFLPPTRGTWVPGTNLLENGEKGTSDPSSTVLIN